MIDFSNIRRSPRPQRHHPQDTNPSDCLNHLITNYPAGGSYNDPYPKPAGYTCPCFLIVELPSSWCLRCNRNALTICLISYGSLLVDLSIIILVLALFYKTISTTPREQLTDNKRQNQRRLEFLIHLISQCNTLPYANLRVRNHYPMFMPADALRGRMHQGIINE